MKPSLSKHRNLRMYLLSFFLPLLVATACFALKGVAPFGSHSVLRSDAWAQYFPFLSEFRHSLLKGELREYTWSMGMGSNLLPLFAYYLSSPFYLLSVFFPEAALPQFTLVLTVVKLGCAGLFFSLYLKSVYGAADPLVPFFSLLYALCAWSAGYYWNIIWLDVFALLPLLTAGTVALLREGRFRLYTLSLSLCFWCNYYLSFCCCLFVLLCFVAYHLYRRCSWKNLLRHFGRFAISTLLAFGLAAALLLPTLLGMGNTVSAKAASFSLFSLNLPKPGTPFTITGFFSSLLQLLGRSLPNTPPTAMEGLPNLFSGFSVVLLGVYYLYCSSFRLRERMIQGAILLLFLLSCLFRGLSYVWHGFHFPNMLPDRFSFLFTFVLLGMAYRGCTQLGKLRLSGLLPPFAVGLLLLAIGLFYSQELSFGYYSAILTVLLLGVMLVIFLLHYKRLSFPRLSLQARRKLATGLLAGVLLAEGFLSMYSGVDTGVSLSSIPVAGTGLSSLLEHIPQEDKELFYRTELTDKPHPNAGAYYRFHGVSGFSSSASVSFNNFASALGIRTWPESNSASYYESSPVTNLLCGIKYLLDTDGKVLNPSYNTVLATRENQKLLYNTAYCGIGFMTQGALEGFVAEEAQTDPIAEQSELFALATGIQEPLYSDYLYNPRLSASEGCTLEASDNPEQFIYTVPEDQSKGSFTLHYTMPREGLLCIATRMQGSKGLVVYRNEEELLSCEVAARGIITLGQVQAGDELRLVYTSKAYKHAGISMRMAFLNTDVFDRGLAQLQDERWIPDRVENGLLSGSIEAKTDGLFFTSIPYEPGWTAVVDGKEVPLGQSYDPGCADVKLTDGVIAFPLSAGSHTITLQFHAPGLGTGLLLSLCAILIFLCLCLFKSPFLLPDLPEPKKENPNE